MKEVPIEYDKRQLLKNKSVSVLKENLLVGDVVCYFERDNSNPIYRVGIVKSFSKRGNTELVVITTVCSDFTTNDSLIELSRYNFIVGLNMDVIYNYYTERNAKWIENVKKELKSVRQKLRYLKKLSHLNKKRFKDLVDSLQNEQHIPNQNQN